jgi:hypothetical protein
LSITATFVPQAWIRENAVDIDGRRDFDIAPALETLSRSNPDFVRVLCAAEWDREGDVQTILAEVIPDSVIDGHSGPFTIEVDLDDIRAWATRSA